MQSDKEKLILTRPDVLDSVNVLGAELSRFFSFSGLSLYFPPKLPDFTWLEDEKKLLLPLVWQGGELGALLCEGCKPSEVKRALPLLPAIINLCLYNLALARALKHDQTTGLATEETLFQHMATKVGSLHSLLANPGHVETLPLYKMCLGMIVVNWLDARQIARQFDYEFCERIYVDLAKAIAQAIDPETIAAPVGRYEGRYEFVLLFPSAGRGSAHKTAMQLLENLENLEFTDKPSGKTIKISLSIGHAQYPQDMLGRELTLPLLEQAIRLRDRARFAGRMASNLKTPRQILAFAQIIKKGGRILENLGSGKYRINLGQAANALEGMRFQIFSPFDKEEKGQLVLLQAGVRESVAELIFVSRVGVMPQAGDRLVLLSPSSSLDQLAPTDSEDSALEIAETEGILSHAEFLSAFYRQSRASSRFTLGISRIESGKKILESLATLFNEKDILKNCQPVPLYAGFYGSNGLIFYHEGLNANDAVSFYEDLRLALPGYQVCSGLFSWPYLAFNRMASESCCLKALEYARLLPAPHIGVLDSVALTISADKKYSLGDAFGAMEEYKQALLASEDNALARNSLGVGLAAMGKLDEALLQLEQALKDAAEEELKAKICYNLATIWQKQEDMASARKFYNKCVRFDPGHFYAWIRLGQLNEYSGAPARKYYLKAAEAAGPNSSLQNVAQRHLARLDAGAKNRQQARDRLHDALLRDPTDAASMLMLARLYLDNQEDPAMAELLARKCASLCSSAESWLVLASALQAQGKDDEAAKALSRAGSEGKLGGNLLKLAGRNIFGT